MNVFIESCENLGNVDTYSIPCQIYMMMEPFFSKQLKVAFAKFLLVCFVSLKESTCETRKSFLFHIESSFRS